MFELLKLSKLELAIYVGLALLGVGGLWWVYDWIGDQREMVVSAEYELRIKAINDRIDVAKDEAAIQTKRLQGEVDAANQRAIELQQARIAAEYRIAAISKRMSSNQPTAESLGRLTAASCGRYAAEVEADFGQCREQYQAMGSLAAGASDAAWTHREAWPRVSRESLDKMRLNNRERK